MSRKQQQLRAAAHELVRFGVSFNVYDPAVGLIGAAPRAVMTAVAASAVYDPSASIAAELDAEDEHAVP